MNILNAYAGVGGNRLFWGNEHNITAIELNKEIADAYKDLFPSDKVIITDAHEYLLKNYMNYDFIWCSPPCQSHSQIRYNIGFLADRKYKKVDAVYPDMKLYQEIILLDNYFKGNWVIENTIPYYEPLIKATNIAGHLWWSNFKIEPFEGENRNHRGGTVETLQDRKQIDLHKYKIRNKRQILRNCVEPEVGLHIFNCATGLYKIEYEQGSLFSNTNEKTI